MTQARCITPYQWDMLMTVLKDNGIDADECETVAIAVCQVLDMENPEEFAGNPPTNVICYFCGWRGNVSDLDLNEHDFPSYCPCCGTTIKEE